MPDALDTRIWIDEAGYAWTLDEWATTHAQEMEPTWHIRTDGEAIVTGTHWTDAEPSELLLQRSHDRHPEAGEILRAALAEAYPDGLDDAYYDVREATRIPVDDDATYALRSEDHDPDHADCQQGLPGLVVVDAARHRWLIRFPEHVSPPNGQRPYRVPWSIDPVYPTQED